ncbi:MAG: hypothetical protein V3U63_02430 [Gemmatimonadota bacterium]
MPLCVSDFRPLEPEELTAQWSDGDLEEEEEEESWDEDLDEDWDDLGEELEGDGLDEDLDEGEEPEVDLEGGDDW